MRMYTYNDIIIVMFSSYIRGWRMAVKSGSYVELLAASG